MPLMAPMGGQYLALTPWPGIGVDWGGGGGGFSHLGLTAAHQVPPCSAAEPAGPATTPDWTQSHSWGSHPTACGCEGLGHAEGQGPLGERWDTGTQRAWRTRGEPGGRGEHKGTWRKTRGHSGNEEAGDRPAPLPTAGRGAPPGGCRRAPAGAHACPVSPSVVAEPPGLTGSLTKGHRTDPEPGCRFQPKLPSRAGG